MGRALCLLFEEIVDYHAHVLRGQWQKRQVEMLHADLQAGKAIVTVDFAMKLLETRYRESSQNWFGKAGHSLLGAMVTTRSADETLHTEYFDLIVESNGE
jgi:hypothetical protein